MPDIGGDISQGQKHPWLDPGKPLPVPLWACWVLGWDRIELEAEVMAEAQERESEVPPWSTLSVPPFSTPSPAMLHHQQVKSKWWGAHPPNTEADRFRNSVLALCSYSTDLTNATTSSFTPVTQLQIKEWVQKNFSGPQVVQNYLTQSTCWSTPAAT